jgi:hypothetical protein
MTRKPYRNTRGHLRQKTVKRERPQTFLECIVDIKNETILMIKDLGRLYYEPKSWLIDKKRFLLHKLLPFLQDFAIGLFTVLVITFPVWCFGVGVWFGNGGFQHQKAYCF